MASLVKILVHIVFGIEDDPKYLSIDAPARLLMRSHCNCSKSATILRSFGPQDRLVRVCETCAALGRIDR